MKALDINRISLLRVLISCSKENGPKFLNFPNVLINSQCNLSILNIHQNT